MKSQLQCASTAVAQLETVRASESAAIGDQSASKTLFDGTEALSAGSRASPPPALHLKQLTDEVESLLAQGDASPKQVTELFCRLVLALQVEFDLAEIADAAARSSQICREEVELLRRAKELLSMACDGDRDPVWQNRCRYFFHRLYDGLAVEMAAPSSVG